MNRVGSERHSKKKNIDIKQLQDRVMKQHKIRTKFS
jgi:hypothetical protein